MYTCRVSGKFLGVAEAMSAYLIVRFWRNLRGSWGAQHIYNQHALRTTDGLDKELFLGEAHVDLCHLLQHIVLVRNVYIPTYIYAYIYIYIYIYICG